MLQPSSEKACSDKLQEAKIIQMPTLKSEVRPNSFDFHDLALHEYSALMELDRLLDEHFQ